MSSKLDNDANRLLLFDHVHYVLEEERLEIESIRCVEVCRYRLRIVVNDNCFVASLLNRPDGMHGRVVEFNPLADPNRAGAEHKDFLLLGLQNFILGLISRVIIRRGCFELRGARIYHFVYRPQIMLLA
ncbi:hypothetical protein D3C77_360110 [compost metagenome]